MIVLVGIGSVVMGLSLRLSDEQSSSSSSLLKTNAAASCHVGIGGLHMSLSLVIMFAGRSGAGACSSMKFAASLVDPWLMM